MNKFLILMFFLCVVLAKAKENKEYRFNWYPVINIGDNIINFPDSSKYETYNSSGVWEDNYGNYGMMECNVSQMTSSSKEISLEGYCEGIDFEKEKFWLSLKRNSFNKAGVGIAKYIYTKNKYNVLINKECAYAALLIVGGGVFKLVCKLSDNEYKLFDK